MPMITVQMYAGRSDQQKADLVEALTVAFVESCGGNREGVWVIVDEVAKENWAMGGRLGSSSPKPS